MALKDLLNLADEKLAEIFNRKKDDPSKARKRIVKGIDRTHAQFHAKEPARGPKWFTHKNDVVRFKPPFEIDGKSEHYIASERFPDYLGHLRGAVETGELDHAIGQQRKAAGLATQSPKRSQSWSPERRAKAAETRKAKVVTVSKPKRVKK